MRVIDPGHLFELDHLDGRDTELLRFVKRIGDKYPGNAAPAYEGTTMQEVLRALISRSQYVNTQRPCMQTALAIKLLREALRCMEIRAARERGDAAAEDAIRVMPSLEFEPTCVGCGHVLCSRKHQ